MTSKSRDLHADIERDHDHYLIESEADGRPVAVGAMQVIRPRGGSTPYHQFFWGERAPKEFDLRAATSPVEKMLPISPGDFPLALYQVFNDSGPISCEIRSVFREIDPGWVELNDGTAVLAAVDSGTGWPTWVEDWYLPPSKVDLDGFNVTVFSKPSTYTPPGSLTKWHHAVSALTGSYENESSTTGWFGVNNGSADVAIIHQIKVDNSHYVDTWWLASGFVWWRSVSSVTAIVSSRSASSAKSIRDGFSTSTRYKHTINLV